MRRVLTYLSRRTEGQDIVEYALNAVLISVCAVIVLQSIGAKVGGIFTGVNDQVVASSAAAGAGGTGGGDDTSGGTGGGGNTGGGTGGNGNGVGNGNGNGNGGGGGAGS